MDSIAYYNRNAKDFYNRTIHVDVGELHREFLEYLPKRARILDAGCGVGRDSQFFLNKGYDVVSFDGSLEMVKIASSLLGKEVLHMLFQEVNFSNAFDAIWANASLLHVPYENLRTVLQRFYNSLVPSGLVYASFKYGTSMRKVEDRFFFDMDEEHIQPYLDGLFKPIKIWKSADTRSQVAASPDKSWLNLIARRVDHHSGG